ncbi:hypothetical protein MRX96_012215 [Rhipicephalus microplus]
MVSNGKEKSCALLLLLTLLSAVLVADVRARSALQRQDQPGGGLIDTRFWQGILNKTLDGNVEQAFNMVIGRMSDDISGAMNRFTGFLDTVRRNVTSVIQDGMRTRNTAT